MPRIPVHETVVDHYLQTDILTRLANSQSPLRFSELKEDGIENSLFMYHANKLLRRGLIAKASEGFHLTTFGARWINSVAPENFRVKPVVLPLVQFFITDNDANILLCKRRGQLKDLINEFVLPGGLHKAGKTAEENAQTLLAWWFPEGVPKLQLETIAEVIHTFEDDVFVHHSISHIFSIRIASIAVPRDEERFTFVLTPIANVKSDNPVFADSVFIPDFIERLRNKLLQPREIFRFHHRA